MILAPSVSSSSTASPNLASTPGWYPSPPSSETTPMRMPATSPCRAAATTGGTAASIEVESHGSCPDIASCSSAASSTVLASGPGVSSEEAKAITPYRDEPP
jgi:hypothetical protein